MKPKRFLEMQESGVRMQKSAEVSKLFVAYASAIGSNRSATSKC